MISLKLCQFGIDQIMMYLFQETLRPGESCSLSNIVPPSVRIEGCTPPSEHNSVDGEHFHYLRYFICCFIF